MALTESTSVSLGSVAPEFSLPGTDGQTYSLVDFAKKRILVVIFMCNHCPYVQACIERLVFLQNEFSGSEVQFIGINPNDSTEVPEDGFEAMKVFYKQYRMNFPYVRDENQEVAKAYGAVCTPDVFVYDEERMLAYHGRIDDNWKDPLHVGSQDLRKALENMIAWKKPAGTQIPSMGCSIKWKR